MCSVPHGTPQEGIVSGWARLGIRPEEVIQALSALTIPSGEEELEGEGGAGSPHALSPISEELPPFPSPDHLVARVGRDVENLGKRRGEEEEEEEGGEVKEGEEVKEEEEEGERGREGERVDHKEVERGREEKDKEVERIVEEEGEREKEDGERERGREEMEREREGDEVGKMSVAQDVVAYRLETGEEEREAEVGGRDTEVERNIGAVKAEEEGRKERETGEVAIAEEVGEGGGGWEATGRLEQSMDNPDSEEELAGFPHKAVEQTDFMNSPSRGPLQGNLFDELASAFVSSPLPAGGSGTDWDKGGGEPERDGERDDIVGEPERGGGESDDGQKEDSSLAATETVSFFSDDVIQAGTCDGADKPVAALPSPSEDAG